MNNFIKKEILDARLSRPSWIKQEHRLLSKVWLDKNECIDPQLNKIVLQSILNIPIRNLPLPQRIVNIRWNLIVFTSGLEEI